jgi:signal transduction histidine kinase
VRGPRLTSDEVRAPLERLTARWPVRYALAVVAIGLVAGVKALIGPRLPADACVLGLFGAILITAVLGGLVPGLVATLLALVAGRYLSPHELTGGRLPLLATEGILISVVGGAFRSTRLKARERLAANLGLEQQILEIGDDERRRIGHDLHDGLGQHLTGISLLSETMAQQIESGKTPDQANVENITRLVSEAVRLTRDLAKSLSPVTLEQDGFVAAMEELADTASALFSIHCHWEFDGHELALDRARALHLFRIVQEAVNNSVRHGKARNVRIGLIRNGRDMSVTVTDDGSGLSQKTMENPGLGLRIMQYRARMLGASLSVERASTAGGTVVTCICPTDQQEPAED